MRSLWWAEPTLRVVVLTTICLLFTTTTPVQADQYAKYNNEGNRLAHEGQYPEALSQYATARIERPGTAEIDFNVGNVLHAMEIYDTALIAYQEALTGLPDPLVPNTYYNIGNTLFRQRDFPKAVEAYKRTLIADPNDRDAKFNLEIALREMEADSSEQKQEPSEDDSDQDSTEQQQEEQEQDGDSTQQSQDQQDQNDDQDNTESQDPQEQDEQEPADQQAQAPPPQGMTEEDAKRILDALKQDELDLQKQRAQRMANPAAVLRDW